MRRAIQVNDTYDIIFSTVKIMSTYVTEFVLTKASKGIEEVRVSLTNISIEFLDNKTFHLSLCETNSDTRVKELYSMFRTFIHSEEIQILKIKTKMVNNNIYSVIDSMSYE